MVSKTPLRSRTLCPECGSPLYYVRGFLTFLTGRHKRVCLASGCRFVDPHTFQVKTHGYGQQ